MRRVSSRQRLVSWDAFDATTTSSSSPKNGDDHVHDDHLNDDYDSSSLSDYETCYDTLPTSPTTTTTTTSTATTLHTTAAVAVALVAKMNRVSSIGSNLSQEADGGTGISSFLKRKRATRSKLLVEPRPSAPMVTATSSNAAAATTSTNDDVKISPVVISTFPWEVDVGLTSSFYSVREEDEAFVTPTTPSSFGTAAASTTSTTTSSTKTTTNISCLPDDVQLHMLSFLAVDDIRRMTQTGRLYNRLIFGSDEAASGLWKNLCRQQWSYLNNSKNSINNTANNKADDGDMLELVDTLHVGSKQQQHDDDKNNKISRPNLNLLLRLAAAPESVPTAVDKTLFQPKRWTRTLGITTTTTTTTRGRGGGGRIITLRSIRGLVEAASAADSAELQERPAPNGRLAVQFIGTVGAGDRCIRANHPLPRPKLLTKSQVRQIQSQQRRYGSSTAAAVAAVATSNVDSNITSLSLSSSTPPAASSSSSGVSFMQRLRRTSRRLASSSSYSSSVHVKPVWQPFVAPFYVRSSSSNADKSAAAVVSVTPRLVAYFEVSILEAPPMTAQDAEDRRRRQQHQQHAAAPWRVATTSSTECVAVGLARGEFSLHTRMPGWDADSYGYHGDDGGIFHNAGHMIRPFGPRFGVGDVVGCGIDYQEQSIFYTLNGTFLGYAFDKIDKTSLEQQDLYPVVGMDTNCLVQVNFGTSGQAFQYNLDAKMDSHKQVICEALRPLTANK